MSWNNENNIMRMTSTTLQFHSISQLFIIITIGISLFDKRPQKRLKRLNLARKNEKKSQTRMVTDI